MSAMETLDKFLECVSKGQYKDAPKYIQKIYLKQYQFIDKRLKQYPKGFVWDITRQCKCPNLNKEVIQQYEVSITLLNGKELWVYPVLVCETEAYKPSVDGDWGVNLASFAFAEKRDIKK